MELEIKTNHHWRPIIFGMDLTAKEKEDFDWIDEEEIDGYVFARYRGQVYALSEFMKFDGNTLFPDYWHGYHSDSFFSGILIKLSDCGESYQIATYFS